MLQKKFSIGISFYKMSSEDWIKIFRTYKYYINDVFFSPVEDVKYQTRRNIYNYETQSQSYLESQLKKVLDTAKELGIALKIVLNVPRLINNGEELVEIYENYNSKYEIDYVTTFLSCAKRIKQLYKSQQLICSYNQGIKTYQELEEILMANVFDSIVLGNQFLRDFKAFHVIHQYGRKVELLLNNGCMSDCESFCSKPNNYCLANFAKNLSRKGVEYLYSENSLFPEELHKYYLTPKLVDYYKLSTRPINFDEINNMLASYIEGNSIDYIKANKNNYHLYARLAHFGLYYKYLNYDQILKNKEIIWSQQILE